jgi:hypothetical protein
MNGDVEDLLREGMERFTTDLRAPAGLIHRVERRRRRRLTLRSVAGAAAVLAAGAVALAAVEVPGAHHNGTEGPVALTAYVVKRVDGALIAAEPGAVAQVTVTTRGTAISGGTNTTVTNEEWSYGDRWRSVTSSPAGHPVYEAGSGTSSTYTLVDYLTRTWGHMAVPGRLTPSAAGRRGCGPVVAALPLLFPIRPLGGDHLSAGSLPATVARTLRSAISCGTLVVAGRQRVDGIETIELTSRRNSPISETVWVSPGTYLPVRMVVHSTSGKPALVQTADITWLSPTARNLANLVVSIPAGFRHVPLISAIRPILQQIPGLSPRGHPVPLPTRIVLP